MFLLRIISMAIGGLRTNFLRSLLATLGVMIGVGAVVAAVSILEGSQRDILKTFESMGADQLLVLNGQASHGQRRTPVSSLLPEDADAVIMDNEGIVIAAAPQFQGGGKVKYGQNERPVPILGTTEDYAKINDYEARDGRFLSKQDLRSSDTVVVLGSKVAEELFNYREAVGNRVKIEGQSFRVIGVMEERGTVGFVDVDSQIIVPLSTAMRRLFDRKYINMLVVQCASARRMEECTDVVTASLRSEHRLRAGQQDDFIIRSQEELKQRFMQFAMIFVVVLYSIAGISMIVGGIGIMNIMLVSVTERTREIGVRIAVGARRFDILRQFLIEAAIISLVGGALGVLCGWAIANLISSVTGELLTIFTPVWSIISALIIAIVVGIVSGIYPAIRAARLDPVQALRFE